MTPPCLPYEFRCNGAGLRDTDAGLRDNDCFHVFDRIA